MTSPEELIGKSIGDSSFVEFWGDVDPLGGHSALDDGYLISNPQRGIAIAINTDLNVQTISLFSGNELIGGAKYGCFKEVLPFKIEFGMSNARVRELLGSPVEENPKFSTFMGVDVLPWQKFRLQNFFVTVTFDQAGKKVTGVSLTPGNETGS